VQLYGGGRPTAATDEETLGIGAPQR